MSMIGTASQEALRAAVPLPLGLQKKFSMWMVGFCTIAVTIAAPAATAHQLQTSIAGWQKLLSSRLSEPTASLAGPEPQAQSAQETQTPPPPGRVRSELDKAANQPVVTFEDGKLTIIAESSALSDILSAVRVKTGADIELPAGASDQRLWAQLGPGPIRRVLATLLEGTNLDYVIRTSETDPQNVQSILLILREKPATMVRPVPSMGTQPPDPNSGLSGPSTPGRTEPSAKGNSDAPESSASPEGAQTRQQPSSADQPPPPADQPVAQPDQSSSPPSPTADTNDPLGRPLGQMIQDLQKMYERRKQLQQQAAKPPAPPPAPN